MTVKEFRIQNFMPFEDTGWMELRPICLLFGRNSSGKSAIIKALRLLRQSLDGQSSTEPFVFTSEYGVDLNSFKTAVHNNEIENVMAFSFRCAVAADTSDRLRTRVNILRNKGNLPLISEADFQNHLVIKSSYAWSDVKTQAHLVEFKITGPWGLMNDGAEEETIIFAAQRLSSEIVEYGEDEWWFWSDLLTGYESDEESAWSRVSIKTVSGFLPKLDTDSVQTAEDSMSRQDLRLVQDLLDELHCNIRSFLEGIEYLGPIRPEPQRVYALDPITRLRWQQRGWGAFLRFVKGEIDYEELKQITKWLAALELGDEVVPDKENYAGDLAIIAQVKIGSGGELDNLADVGYGTAQVLPIIVECVLAERDVLVIIEQPELHLHPRAQAQLADLLVEVATRGDRLIEERQTNNEPLPTPGELSALRVRFLIETHSEHLLLRLRRRIAESAAGKLDKTQRASKPICSDALVIYFVDRLFGASNVQQVTVDRRGDFEYIPGGFRDFFADDIDDVLMLSKARREVKSPE